MVRTADVSTDATPWLAEHKVMGQILVPGAAFMDMMLSVEPGRCVEGISISAPLALGVEENRAL